VKSAGAASPQEVVAAIRKAAAAKDFTGVLPLIAPDGLRELAADGVAGILIALAFSNPDDPMPGSAKPSASELAAQRKRYQQALDVARRTLQPSGLDSLIGKPPLAAENQKVIEAAVAKTDNVALVTALHGAMLQIGTLFGIKDPMPDLPVPNLGPVTGYTVTGNTATAQAGTETLDFVRVNGRWYIRPPSRTGAPPPSSPAATAPLPRASASGTQPEIVVGGLQIVRVVAPRDDFSARPFNTDNGTRLVLWIKMPAGQGLIEIDDDASVLQHFGDDKGGDLGGRFDSFPDEFQDHSGGTLEIASTAQPSAGATTLVAEGTVSLVVATGSRKTRVPKITLRNDQKFTLNKIPITVADVSKDGDGQSFTLKLPRQLMVSIKSVAFFDAAGAALEGRRAGSGYSGDSAEMTFSVKTAAAAITLEFDVWQSPRTVKVPFKVRAGFGG
jgi:hypothetical protein